MKQINEKLHPMAVWNIYGQWCYNNTSDLIRFFRVVLNSKIREDLSDKEVMGINNKIGRIFRNQMLIDDLDKIKYCIITEITLIRDTATKLYVKVIPLCLDVREREYWSKNYTKIKDKLSNILEAAYVINYDTNLLQDKLKQANKLFESLINIIKYILKDNNKVEVLINEVKTEKSNYLSALRIKINTLIATKLQLKNESQRDLNEKYKIAIYKLENLLDSVKSNRITAEYAKRLEDKFTKGL